MVDACDLFSVFIHFLNMINWFHHVVAATISYFITKLSFSNILFRKLSNTVTLGRHQIWIQKTCLAFSINININIVQDSQRACRKLKYFFQYIRLICKLNFQKKMNIVQSHQGMSRCIWRWICLPALLPSRSLPRGSCSSALVRRAGCVRINLFLSLLVWAGCYFSFVEQSG